MGLLFFSLLDFKLCHHFVVPDVIVGLVPNLEIFARQRCGGRSYNSKSGLCMYVCMSVNQS